MDQNGPFWPEEAHFGPFRSANRTLAIPDQKSIKMFGRRFAGSEKLGLAPKVL